MAKEHFESPALPQKKLTGWKMIGRHLGRTERAVQLWEVQRRLPVHRIPGGRGQTVFAYVDELDAWMNGAVGVGATLVPAPQLAETPAPARPPGILVLPLEGRFGTEPCLSGDLLCQQLIVRLSAVQPVRVLSWTTSRTVTQCGESIEATAARLNVRYIVESRIESSSDSTYVDVQIVDADIDQIMLADRFVVANNAPCTAYAELAEGVALHFALLHAGALVEPMCLGDLGPALFIEYLAAARYFFDDVGGSTGQALRGLDRILSNGRVFAPAQAMRGLALMQLVDAGDDRTHLEEARRMLATCVDDTAARVTTAFLGAAIVKHAEMGNSTSNAAVKSALRWIPPSVASQGRLYERRALRRREDLIMSAPGGSGDRRGKSAKAYGHKLLDELLKDLVAVHERYDRCSDSLVRPHTGQLARALPSANDQSIFASRSDGKEI